MTTAIDSSVIIDALDQTSDHGIVARQAIARVRRSGRLVACDAVWAELAGRFPSEEQCTRSLAELGVEFDSISQRSASLAGHAWRQFRHAAGGRRERIAVDFLVGGHALHQADRLLAHHRGFYGKYFKGRPLVYA